MSRDLYILSFPLTIHISKRYDTQWEAGNVERNYNCNCNFFGNVWWRKQLKNKKNRIKFDYFINGRHALFLVAGPLRGGGVNPPNS